MIMKIVFLDRKTIGEDIDLTDFETLGEVVTYEMSQPEEVPERVVDADDIIVNKVPVNEQTIGTAQNLKLVCVAPEQIIWIKIIWINGELNGEMQPDIPPRSLHSTHLPCSFICSKSYGIMMIM